MRGTPAIDFWAGFVVGFVLNCCGVVLASMFFRGRYFQGAVLGWVTNIGMTVLGAVSADLSGASFTGPGSPLSTFIRDTPAELLLAGGGGCLFITVGLLGLVFFVNRDDDDDHRDGPRSGPDDQVEWVTYGR